MQKIGARKLIGVSFFVLLLVSFVGLHPFGEFQASGSAFAAPPEPVPRPADTKEPSAPPTQNLPKPNMPTPGVPKPKSPMSNPSELPLSDGPTVLYRVHLAKLESYKDADISRMARATVTRVIDGDTIEVTLEGKSHKVRLIGVDTPETVAPGRAVERFGKEASQFTKSKLEKKTVYLAFDWDLYDRYGRLLAYVYLQDRTCFNAELIRLGYGHAYTKYPFQFLEEFRGLEAEARRARRGLWGVPP